MYKKIVPPLYKRNGTIIDYGSGTGNRTRLSSVRGLRPEPIDDTAINSIGSRSGIRTRVAALKGRCPNRLDDAAI